MKTRRPPRYYFYSLIATHYKKRSFYNAYIYIGCCIRLDTARALDYLSPVSDNFIFYSSLLIIIDTLSLLLIVIY